MSGVVLSQMWSALASWGLHVLLAKGLLRAMALPSSAPWLELLAYTGYTFVPVVLSMLAGLAAGRWECSYTAIYNTYMLQYIILYIYCNDPSFGHSYSIVHHCGLGYY